MAAEHLLTERQSERGKPGTKAHHFSFYAMGTRCHVVLSGIEKQRAGQVYQVVKQEINRVETCLSRFISYSEIAVLNARASSEPVEVSDEIFGVLKTCKYFNQLTGGAFDITLRPLLNYWKSREGNNKADFGLYELMDLTGMRFIHLDDEHQTVYLLNETVELDLGGFGKGYALEKVYGILKKMNLESAFISFGESSILTIGRHPAGTYWKIGLNNYIQPGTSVHQFELNDGSVSTSGNFYLDDHGKLQNHRHIINPINGYPVQDLVTASVSSSSPVVAEILSTACLVMGDEAFKAVIQEVGGCSAAKIHYSSDNVRVTKF